MSDPDEEVEEAQDAAEDEDADAAIKAKYDKLTRQIFPQKIELPISALLTMVEQQIELRPEFQRRDVWDDKKRSKFIESLLMNVPIPPVFLGEDSYGKYVVLDGRQRLSALVRFMNNEYELVGLKVWSELNGQRYSDLRESNLDVGLTRRFVPAVVLLKESSPEVKYDVFERLNTGGLNLNAMEIRNAVFRGKFTDLLHDCARHKSFLELWGIPAVGKSRDANAMYARMMDLEQALRFFALSAAQHKGKRAAFSTYLGTFMAERNKQYAADAKLGKLDRARFEGACDACLNVLGRGAFIRSDRRSPPLADALMYGFEAFPLIWLDDPASKERIRDHVLRLLENPHFQDCLGQGTNGRAKIELRLDLARQAIEAGLTPAAG